MVGGFADLFLQGWGGKGLMKVAFFLFTENKPRIAKVLD